MPLVSESRFWEPLIGRYARAPSIALCRVPELELLSRVRLEAPALDHCGGDGLIASLAFPGEQIEACVDLDPGRLATAERSGRYRRVESADAGRQLPFTDGTFATVFNNSGIEHIPDLATALAEIARVLRPGGQLVLNVLNKRYFDNWPGPAPEAAAYREWQPFHHALDETEWRAALDGAGFTQVGFLDYFEPEAGRVLADLDYRHSGLFLRKRLSLATALELARSADSLKTRWRRELGSLRWDASPGTGVGFQVSARRRH